MYKIIFILILSAIFLLASYDENPHDLDIVDVDINSQQCAYCHTSYYGQEPDYTSILCLNCHDGIQAKNMLIRVKTVHVDKLTSHPYSVDYIENKNGLKPKHTVIQNWDDASTINDLLLDGKIECISCHNPHNKTNASYLRHTNSRDSLCTTCHQK